MIVNRKQAEEAWTLLRQHARVADEIWDEPHMTNLDGITPDDVNRAYRTAVRYVHPDTGGTAEQFAAVDRAKHVVLHWQSRQSSPRTADLTQNLCDACEGTGFLRVRAGFSSGFRRQCPKCRGTGDLNFEHDNGGGD